MTYEEVAENHPAYVKWARETVEEGQVCNAKLRKFVTWLNNNDKEAETHLKTENQRPSSAAASTARTSDGRGTYGGRRIKRMPDKDADAMKAEIPLLEENPIPENKVEEQILRALENVDKRLNSLETKQTQQEKHYTGPASESWQNLPSDRGTETE